MNKQTAKAEGDSAKYRDLSLPELFDMFPDDKAAMEWLEENVWPDGRRCGLVQNPSIHKANHAVSERSHLK